MRASHWIVLVALICAPFHGTDAAIGLKIYADETDTAPSTRVNYGYDRDAVCTRGTCDDGTTVCGNNGACSGIGSGTCNYTPCTNDFTGLCEDDATVCENDSDCMDIGTGNCVTCAPPNRICGVKVDSLTPGAPTDQTIWGLVCNPATPPAGTDCQVGVALPPTTVSWDFHDVNLTNLPDLKQTASSVSTITSAEFEPGPGDNSGDCGFNPGGAFPDRTLGREDKDYPNSAVPTLNSLERENGVRVCDDGKICTNDSPDCNGIGDGICKENQTIWLRGVVRFEGVDSSILGAGESRICHHSEGRTEVPLWRFPNQDGAGWFMEYGDNRWEHETFDCEPVIRAPSPANVRDSGQFEGKLTGQVVNEGLVWLPSGHQFQALVARSNAEYSVYIVGCLINVDDVRTVVYLWQVPHLGTVARLQSDKIAPNVTDFTHLAEIDIKYGLFPPLSVTVGTVTAGSVELSWDPGLITDHISDYRIYWDTESGGQCSTGLEDCTADHPGAGNCPAGETCCGTPGDFCTSYQSDSVNDAGQVVFNTATSATISGLAPNTTYYFTVTSRSSFTNPASSVTTTYESLLYPTQVPAVPVDLPVEVSATTLPAAGPAGATPNGDARPGTQLTLARVGGGMLGLAWGASCLGSDTDYEIYEGTLGSFASHVPIGVPSCTTGGATSKNITPGGGNRYYLVVPHNGSSEGSYGVDSDGFERSPGGSSCRARVFGGCP